jgi:hypothetical protein
MKLSLLVASLILCLCPICANAQDLRVRIDLSEPEAMLAAADGLRNNGRIEAAQLETVLQTPAAKHLRGTHALTAENIGPYITSAEFSAQAGAFQFSLREWRMASRQQIERRIGEYLPPEGQLSLTVVVVLAPGFTEAEFDTSSIPPRVFVPLVPSMLHMRQETYVGEQVYLLASAIAIKSLQPHYNRMTDSVRLAVEYTTEFRRGIALLAGAGGPGLHICATCPRAERQQWDNDLVAFGTDFQKLNKLLLATALAERDIEGHRSQLDSVSVLSWQVLGYRMAVTIEQHYGRKVLPNLLRDPRMLLELYNLAAAADNASGKVDEPLPLWSPELMRLFGLTPARGF